MLRGEIAGKYQKFVLSFFSAQNAYFPVIKINITAKYSPQEEPPHPRRPQEELLTPVSLSIVSQACTPAWTLAQSSVMILRPAQLLIVSLRES